MIRSLFFLLKLFIFVIFIFFLMKFPGKINIEWVGFRSETTVPIFLVFFICLFLIVYVFFLILRFPGFFRKWRNKKHQECLENNFLKNMSAIASGRLDCVKKKGEGKNLIPVAQAFYMKGDFKKAEELFNKLCSNIDTAFLGYRGLALVSLQQQDFIKTKLYLNKALEIDPHSPWVLEQLLLINSRSKDEKETQFVFSQLEKSKKLPKDRLKRLCGIKFFLLSEKDPNLLEKAYNYLPDNPIVSLKLAKLYQQEGHFSKAKKVLKATYSFCPHIDLIRFFDCLNTSQTLIDRFQEAEKFTNNYPHSPETLLGLAEIALKGQLWGKARQLLEKAELYEKSQRLYPLFIELEEKEYPRQWDRIKHYLKKVADAAPSPKWVCHRCLTTYNLWEGVCVHCGAIDQIVWAASSSGKRALITTYTPQ